MKKINEKRELGLEEIIHMANKIGIDYAEKRREAEKLELMRTSVRAQIMNRIEREYEENLKSVNENKLKRLSEADPVYLDVLEKISMLRSESEKLRIRYESYRSLFEAKRTLISYKKVEMKI
jgi:hypothetical protein